MPISASVLLLDLIGSSELADRQAATDRVQAAQEIVNRRFDGYWLAPLETTRGDETAAVLHHAAPAYDVIRAMADAIHPLRLRAVLVYGELVAGIDTGRATIIDGPAFQRADATMEDLKGSLRLCAFQTAVTDLDRPASALGNLLLWNLAQLTDLQRRILCLYQEIGNQQEVARRVGRSQQQVSATLRASAWELIDEGERALRGLLAKSDRRGTLEGKEPARREEVA